jgi:16S rRNA C967 or C1407 C5-methylase (RsmB/RsmF family)
VTSSGQLVGSEIGKCNTAILGEFSRWICLILRPSSTAMGHGTNTAEAMADAAAAAAGQPRPAAEPPPGKRPKKKQQQQQQHKERRDVPFPPTTFSEYYRELATDDADHAALMAAMCRPLPTAFRSAGDAAAVDATSAELHRKFSGVPQLRPLGWHSDAWKLVCSRQELRSSEQLAALHRWLVGRHEAGAVRRQEEASMLSVALLGAQPGECIVDMCASPGSKSSELADQVGSRGLLIANDNDLKRCWMLMHTMRRFPRPALVVTHHEAQNLPHLPGGAGFDRVLCDVPCSGDGTLRKARSHWERKGWKPTLGVSLQPLQLAIARRGLQVLKRGGHLLYSTCSLNPVENEAVVAALLAEGGCELVDVHSGGRLLQHAGAAAGAGSLRLREGLTSWRIANGDHPHWRQGVPGRGTADAPLWFGSAAEARAADGPSARQLSSPLLYPPPAASATRSQLSRCGRLLPQDNDTGGFFVALFVKTADYAPDLVSAPAASEAEGAAASADAAGGGGASTGTSVGKGKDGSEDEDVSLQLKKAGQLRAGGATSKNSNVPSSIQALASSTANGKSNGKSKGKGKGKGNGSNGDDTDSGSAEPLTVADSRFPEEMASIRSFYALPPPPAAAVAAAAASDDAAGDADDGDDSSDGGDSSDGQQGVLLTRSASEGVLHRVFWVSKVASSLAVLSRAYTVVGAGTAVFEFTRARGATCDYRLCSDAAALWAAQQQQHQQHQQQQQQQQQPPPPQPALPFAPRTVWLGKRAWSTMLHGPGSGTEAAMPVSVLIEAGAADNTESGDGGGSLRGPEVLEAAAGEAEGSSSCIGAGCLLLRLRDVLSEGEGEGEGAAAAAAAAAEAAAAVAAPARPETCVVGWLGAAGGSSSSSSSSSSSGSTGSGGRSMMLFCAANDLAILRELYPLTTHD